jgi:hypothetical protein
MSKNHLTSDPNQAGQSPTGLAPHLIGSVGLAGSGIATETHDAPLSPLETQHFVREAPHLTQLAAEAAGRTASFTYLDSDGHITASAVHAEAQSHSETEGEGITKLINFLDNVAQDASTTNFDEEKITDWIDLPYSKRIWPGLGEQEVPTDASQTKAWIQSKARALRETYFLGTPEFEESARGLGSYWTGFLAEDSERQICLPEPTKGKSDAFVQESILETLSETEREQFRGRIVRTLDELTSPPEKTKVIFVDDWMMNGDQMFERTNKLYQDDYDNRRAETSFEDTDLEVALAGDAEPLNPDRVLPETRGLFGKYRDAMEINLLIGDEKRLAEGSDYTADKAPIPVKAYYKANIAADSEEVSEPRLRYRARISGIYSSADYNFSYTISNIIKLMNEARTDDSGQTYTMPPLTNIVRSYREFATPVSDALIPKPQPKTKITPKSPFLFSPTGDLEQL